MIIRFLCVLAFVFPIAAYAQDTDTSAPNLSGVMHGPVGVLPEGTAKGHALPPPGMDGSAPPVETPNMQESCAKPMELIGQPKSVLDTMKLKNATRVLGPDSAATMDYSPARTNILYDKQGIIREIHCG